MAGFLLCALITAASSCFGYFSLKKVQKTMTDATDKISTVTEQRIEQSGRISTLRLFLSRINHASSVDDLQNAMEDLSVLRKNWKSDDAWVLLDLVEYGLAANILEKLLAEQELVTLLDEVSMTFSSINITISSIADAIPLESKMNVSRTVEAIREKASRPDEDISNDLDAIMTMTGHAVGKTKSALSIRNFAQQLEWQLRMLLHAKNLGEAEQFRLTISGMISSAIGMLRELPWKGTETILIDLFSSLEEDLENVFQIRKRIILGENVITKFNQYAESPKSPTVEENGLEAIPERIRQMEQEVFRKADAMREELEKSNETSRANVGKWKNILTGIIVLSFAAAIVVGFFSSGIIIRGVGRMVIGLRGVADYDLTSRLGREESCIEEIVHMVEALNSTIEILHSVAGEISRTGDTLAEAAEDLTKTSDSIAANADSMRIQSEDAAGATDLVSANIQKIASASQEVSAQVASVANASETVTRNMREIGEVTENVSGNLGSVAASSEKMSKGINTMASAIEEMYTSLNEVSKNTARSAGITHEASEKANQTAEIMLVLATAAEEIGDVVELIKGIASQTNLLALNATIEAAGAGPAGKGFAVVANEVKELARQTAKSTEEINKKIGGIQTRTEAATKAIGDIVNVISELNVISTFIAGAVDQQTATTNEISRSVSALAASADSVSANIQEAAEMAEEMSKNVNEAVRFKIKVSENLDKVAENTATIAVEAVTASGETEKVAENVRLVNDVVKITSQGTVRIKNQAENLADLARQLQAIIRQFKLSGDSKKKNDGNFADRENSS